MTTIETASTPTPTPVLPADVATRLHDDGVAVVPAVLGADLLERARRALAAALDADRAAGEVLYREGVDPNDRNLRVLTLLGRDPVFAELVVHPATLALARLVLGDGFQLSSLSANIALPGSGSMGLHSDLMAVLPEPWPAPYGANVLFYLDDTDEENGATRYLPGSHHFTSSADASQSDLARTVPIEAPAGSLVAVDGRLWHTSGANTSVNRDRSVIISFFVSHFLRTQYNWHAMLGEETKQSFSPALRDVLGLDTGNMKVRLGYDAFKDTKQGEDPHAR